MIPWFKLIKYATKESVILRVLLSLSDFCPHFDMRHDGKLMDEINQIYNRRVAEGLWLDLNEE